MASIREINGRFHVQIRKKNLELSATFADKETAELWSMYKENTHDEILNFSPPIGQLFTLKDAIRLKVESLKEKNSAKKTISDTSNLEIHFQPFINLNISEITFDQLCKHCEDMLNLIVTRGGYLGKGSPRQQSYATVYKKFRYLAIVFSFMQENGAKISNPAIAVIRELEKKYSGKDVIQKTRRGHSSYRKTLVEKT